MSTKAWRLLLLGLCAFGVLQLLLTVWMQVGHMAVLPGFTPSGFAGSYGVEITTVAPFADRLTVTPGSDAYRVGLRTGDIIDLRALSPGERYRWETKWWWLGERADLTIRRGSATLHFAVRAMQLQMTSDGWFANAGIFWMLLFAGIISWLRPERRDARVLALLLILSNIGLSFQPQNWITPWPALDAVLAAFSGIPNTAGIALLATYAMLFALPASALRSFLAWASYVCAAVAALYTIAACAGAWTARVELPMELTGHGAISQLLTIVLPCLFPVLCLLAAIAATRGVERSRVSWAGVPLSLEYVSVIVFAILVTASAGSGVERVFFYAVNVTLVLAPLGLTYSLLNRRLLDVSFAINRAAVFTGVSVVIVGIFVLAEWAISEWFSSASHTANLAISAVLALVLGLSVRAIHSRVDRVLDTIFFRKRHEDEQAIRTLAREAAYVTDPQILISRMVAVLEEHADASSVHVLLDEGGQYESISENDPAIVRLRATSKVLDLHDVQTAIRGEFAYPMVARGRLVGVLVLGLKRNGESYAPDESDAIAQLAHDAGVALDVLLARGDAARDDVLDEIRIAARATYEAVAALTEELRASRSIEAH